MLSFKSFNVLFCGLLFVSSLLAQEVAPPPRYLTLGLGSTYHRLQDPAVSPMTYTGSPFHISLGFEKFKGSSISILSLGADIGQLTGPYATELLPMASQHYRIDLQYAYLKRISDLSRSVQWYLGGQYRLHNSIRLTPQNDTGFISFLISNALSVTGRASWNWTAFARQTTFEWTGTIPVLNHVVRPSYLNLYNYLDPENNFLGERFEQAEWLTLNRFPELNSQIAWRYPIAGENVVSLIYNWSFYHYSGQRRVNAARHLFLVQLSIRI